MRSEPSQVKTTESRTRTLARSRRQSARRRGALEALEPRTLMATLPASAVSPTSSVFQTGTGNMSSPSIAIDQNNPQKLAAVWTVNDPTFAPGPTEVVQAAVSADGGKTWQSLGRPGPFEFDPTTNPEVPFAQWTDASVAFDRNDNFYVLYSQHEAVTGLAAAAPVGELLLSKYNFSTGSAQQVFANNPVYKWVTADAAMDPALAVDSSVAKFSDVDSNGVTRNQSDPNSGNVYIAWESVDTAPAFNPPNFNPNRVRLVTSTDGGQSFSGEQSLNDNGNSGPGRATTPQLTVSQGASSRGVNPGQVTVTWDDFGVGATASPPFDVVKADRTTGVNSSATFSSQGGPIVDAGPGTPNSPSTTDFPVTVAISDPRFLSVSDLVVSMEIIHPAVQELKIQLIPPPGSNLAPITLVQNQTDAAGTSNQFIGVSGGNIGVIPNGPAVGTVFDDLATRDIVDLNNTGGRGASAPYIGHFRPEVGSLLANYAGAVAGAANSPGSVNGTWTLRITDFRNNNAGTLLNWAITLTSGLTPGVDSNIATVHVRGLQGGGQTATAADAQGIGPDPVLTSDNTLGAYSQFQGRIYAAFVDRFNDSRNPPDNTDIYLAYSDNGGLSWNRQLNPVNDDIAQQDGFSEGGWPFPDAPLTGRPQFQPSIAVDNATGTLVVSWLDTRNDPARARVATYLTTSLDGGQTFSPNVFVNDPQTATDAITGKTVNLGPIPENESSGNPNTEGTVGFGSHQGLAVYDGHAYPIWSSNQNGGGDAKEKLGIRSGAATFAAGPRVINITQGPIGGPNDTVNTSRGPDGGPVASAFVVTFDRPIDPTSFGTNDVKVLFRDTTPTNVTGGPVPISSVVPLDNGPLGATQFQVNFAPRTGVGTYSIEITPNDIHDRIRTVQNVVTASGPPQTFASPNVPQTVAPSSFVFSSNPVNVPAFAGHVVANVTVTVNITTQDASSLTLFLVAPDGTRVLLARNEPFLFAGGQDYANTTFDDAASTPISQGFAPFTGTFRPEIPLNQFIGHPLNGNWQLEVQSSFSPQTAQLVTWSMTLTPGTVTAQQNPGNKLDQNVNGVAGEARDFFATPMPLGGTNPFAGPFSQDTLPLILPGPHVASTRVPGAPATPDNLVLNNTVNAIDVTFDRDMNPASITAASVLGVMGPNGPISGPFTVTPNPQGSDPDPAHPRTYRIGFPTQTLSGTYTVTLASSVTDSHGNALDENLNAGVDLLKGTVTGPTQPVTYTSNVPTPIGNGKTVVSSLNVPDSFLAEGVTVSLDISYPNDPDLQVTLVSPANVPIVLIPTGVGTTGTHANFSGTIFDDAASTLIQNGGPPFFGRFKPAQPLSTLNGSAAQGTWKLVVNSASGTTSAGTLTDWSLTFQKGVPSSGLGESVADQAHVSFRIFTMDPTNRQSSTTWTAVGPASMTDPSQQPNNGFAGQIGGIAVDPSDPSGNTVYVAGASGGVWKTTDFLTSSPQGPTYIPLTDFGPTTGLNIGGLAVFGRNNDPRQSIVFAGTGNGDASFGFGGNTSAGVGFLRSMDGGATWALLDSTNNNLPFAFRDHLFAQNGGTSTMKVVVDPHPLPNGQVIVYAAMVGTHGGLWRSVDTGATWQKMSDDAVEGTNATDVILDYNSGTPNAVSNPTGNLNILYAAFAGTGVFISPNRGQVLTRMNGGNVDPLIIDTITDRQVPVSNNATPNGAAGGRIVLAKPTPLPSTAPRADVLNTLYESWLYAAIADASGNLDGVYLTKDNGQTWTKLKLSTLPDQNLVPRRAVPTNDSTQGDYNVVAGRIFAHGNYDISLTVDPNNPNIAYLGGTADGNETGLIRIDATGVYDSHAVVSYTGSQPGSSPLQINSTGRAVVDNNQFGPSTFVGTSGAFGVSGPYINLASDPTQPFQTNATVFVHNVASFTNDGSGVLWTPFDKILQANAGSLVPSSNVHRVISEFDPLTGRTRLIFGDDQGVFTGVVMPDGSIDPGIGNAVSATYSRNGNLQIAQQDYGAIQSSAALAAQVNALIYGNGLSLGQTASDPNVLQNGDITHAGSTDGSPLGIVATTSADEQGTGVAAGVDAEGENLVYRYYWPTFGGNLTDFFQVSINGGPFISRTTGLEQTAVDPQWPPQSPVYANGLTFGNFAINPVNAEQVIISSNAGRVFATTNAGQFWLSIGEPGALDGSYAPALAFGAPDPTAPGGIGNLNNFLYAGTVNGNIFVSRTGGGAAFNSWTKVSTGLDGSPVVKIITDPTRGSHDAYAVTQKGVYYITDSTAAGASWQNITGNLFSLTTSPFGNASQAQPSLSYLTSIVADWRYVIPTDPTNPNSATHPVVYVSGDSGVYRSLDNGQTWLPFPSATFDGAPADGGYLPNAAVTDLNVALGQIDPTTGRAVAVAGDPNLLLATTYGRGDFGIRLAPIVFNSSVALDTALPAPTGSFGGTDANGLPIVNVAQPVIDGISEQTAFGNLVRVSILDLTDPNNPHVIGGYDPSKPATDVPANRTDSAGHFQVQVNAGGFTSDGVKTIGIQATDGSGTQGNIATFQIDLTAKLPTQSAPAVPTILLNPQDDSSGGLDITNVTSPHVIGSTDPGVQVQLFKSVNGAPTGTALATGTTDALGNYSLAFPASPDGTYNVQVVATNQYGSTRSNVLTFTIATTAPTVVPTLTLSPADDTGVKGDNITSARQPHFVGTAVPHGKITLSRVVNGVAVPPALATTTADANGNFSIQLPFVLSNGPITLQVGESDAAGNQGPNSTPLSLTIVSVPGDYTGAGRSTPAVFVRAAAGPATWLIQGVPPAAGIPFGASRLDVPFQGDFDGDGVTDLAVYRPGNNTWYVRRSKLGDISFPLGAPGSIPTVGDFDGDGVTDAAAYNPTTGVWTLAESTAGLKTVTFPASPQPGDVPVPGNYDGTGKDELAVYRPANGQFIIQSVVGNTTTTTTVALATGSPGDVPVPGAYNNTVSTHKTEPAVFNPATGKWVVAGPAGNVTYQFQPGDIPAPGDYAGTGSTQAVVYRPGAGSFISSGNNTVATIGPAGAIPVSSPLAYRNIVATAPTLALDPASDTGIAGDGLTSARRPFFVGTTDPNALVDLINAANGRVLGTTAADATGAFRVQPAASLTDGSYSFQARAHGIVSNVGPVSTPVSLKLITVAGDFTGAGKTSVAVFRRTGPFLMQWFVQGGPAALAADSFGAGSLDVPVPGDYDADGLVDPAVYRPSTGQWFLQPSTNGYASQPFLTFGAPNVDVPVPADYYGTGQPIPAVYRPTTGQWFVFGQAAPVTVAPGRAGDVPVPANYDNTGADEMAVYRPVTGQWIIQGPGGAYSVFFGGPQDVPVPGAYDATAVSRTAEEAVFRPSTGQYFIRTGVGQQRIVQFAAGDIPIPGDYDGIGKTEPAVFRPSTGQFFVMGPNDATPRAITTFGWPNHDVPPIAPYAYRALKSGGGVISAFGAPSAPAPVSPGSSSSNGGGVQSVALSSLTPPPARPPVGVTAAAVAGSKVRLAQHLARHPLTSPHRLVGLHTHARKRPGQTS